MEWFEKSGTKVGRAKNPKVGGLQEEKWQLSLIFERECGFIFKTLYLRSKNLI